MGEKRGERGEERERRERRERREKRESRIHRMEGEGEKWNLRAQPTNQHSLLCVAKGLSVFVCTRKGGGKRKEIHLCGLYDDVMHVLRDSEKRRKKRTLWGQVNAESLTFLFKWTHDGTPTVPT